ncbi:hypothetical protein GS500_06835 [Rhodococcus hoagii]|nr:hypothetical protein [Prescottella equi]
MPRVVWDPGARRGCGHAKLAGMSDEHAPVDDPSRTTAKPFILAVSIVAILMIGIVVSALLRPADESRSDADRLNASATDFVRASNNADAEALDRMVCDGFAEDRSPIAGREGEVVVEALDNAVVDGDSATADVRISAKDDKGATTSTWTFVLGDDRWLVCD